MNKNRPLMGHAARFMVGLVCFYLAFSPLSLFALEPEDVQAFGTIRTIIWNAYVRALPYLPNVTSAALQRRIGVWAYDPDGHSAYAVITSSIDASGTSVPYTAEWSQVPWVIGESNTACPASRIAAAPNYNYTWACGTISATRGVQGSIRGSVACARWGYPLYDSYFVSGNTCPGTFSFSCVTGGTKNTWTKGVYEQTGWDVFVGGGTYEGFMYIPDCAPVVHPDEFSHWQELPLPNDVLEDTAMVAESMTRALGSPDVTAADREQITAGRNALESGVAVPSGNLPPVTSEEPREIWDFDAGSSTGMYTNNYYAVGTTSVSVNVSVNVSTAEIVNGLFDVREGVDITNTNLLNISTTMAGIYDLMNSSSSVDTSTATYWAQWEQFQNTYSSAPYSFFEGLIPKSTATWVPCFDITGFWSGPFAGSRPAGNTGVVCLTSFPGWDGFIMLLKCSLILTVSLWGVFGFWDLLKEIRLPGIAGSWQIIGWVAAAGMIAFSYFVYDFATGYMVYIAGVYANCIGACQGFNSLTNPSELVLMFNYLGVTQAFALYLTFINLKWNFILFMNFWGTLKK